MKGTRGMERVQGKGSPFDAASPADDPRLRLLDWLGTTRVGTYSDGYQVVAAMIRLGLDPVVDGYPDDPDTGAGYVALAEAGWRGDPALLRRALPRVGWRIIAGDPANVPEWEAAAAVLEPALRHRLFLDADHSTTAGWADEVYQAGRGPGWAADLFRHAVDAEVPPNLLGYEAWVTPALLSAAATAGLSKPVEVKVLRGHGFTFPDLLTLLDEGRVSPGALLAAHLTGVPRTDWATLLPGLPEHWFPIIDPAREVSDAPRDVVADSLLGKGFDWEQLRTLADHGFTEVRTGPNDRIGYGVNRNRVRFTPNHLVTLSRWVSPAQLHRWVEALLTGRSSAGHIPPLSGYSADHTGNIVRLVQAGVRPGDLLVWRTAGCRSVDDVVAGVDAGITAGIAADLVARFGVTGIRHRGKAFRSAAELLRHARQGVAR